MEADKNSNVVIGILRNEYDGVEDHEKRYLKILEFNNIDYILLSIHDADFWNKVKKIDLFIFKWHHTTNHHQLAKTIMPIIENDINIPCYPDYSTAWHYDDKIRQYYLCRLKEIPYTESWIFWNKTEAYKWIEKAALPVIFKLKEGAASQNVVKITNIPQGKRLIRKMFGRGITSGKIIDWGNVRIKKFQFIKEIKRVAKFFLHWIKGEDHNPFWNKQKNYVLFQKFLSGNDFDTRITVVGDIAYGFRRFNRVNDFRSSGSGIIDYDEKNIDLMFVKTAFEISKKLNSQVMAYDFLYNEDRNPECCEISYAFNDKAIFKCNGYWDDRLNWHEGHYWPQFHQLQFLLKRYDLKQPEITI